MLFSITLIAIGTTLLGYLLGSLKASSDVVRENTKLRRIIENIRVQLALFADDPEVQQINMQVAEAIRELEQHK